MIELLYIIAALVLLGIGYFIGIGTSEVDAAGAVNQFRESVRLPTPQDIYSTIHMPEGDFDSLPPDRVEINGAMTVYHFPFKSIPFEGEIRTTTLHRNGLAVKLKVNPPVWVRRGDNLTIVQPVEMSNLLAHDPVEEPS